MKRKAIKVGVLTLVFLIALVISSMVINKGTEDTIIDMGAPTLPRISFVTDGKEVNHLFGYVQDMDITAMRDTIVPLEVGGGLAMNVETYGNKISSIRYEAWSMDGKNKLKEGDVDVPADGEQATLKLDNVVTEEEPEAVLKIVLTIPGNSKDKEVSYYTRIARPDDITTSQCLAFAQDFHTKAINKESAEELQNYLEPGEESDNTTYQTVNIHSDITHIQWGSLNPQIVGDVEWDIKESNTVYTSILAKYQVACEDDKGRETLYNIKEFFRIRYLEKTIYLLDYNRDMEAVFQGTAQNFDNQGIVIGIASQDLPFETNNNETMVAFVQERELWLYNGEKGEVTQVFSFADQEGQDIRSRNDQHAVRIISMDKKGNLSFAVYGYMNRGSHEGEVGVGIYYFNTQTDMAEEKAFIPSTKSYAIAADELGKMVYYNHSQSMLYVLADGTLYQIDLDNDKQTVLAKNLDEGQYAVSDDGHLMAYQTKGSLETADRIQVLNLKTGEKYHVDAPQGDAVRPLGFVNGDFVYGLLNAQDKGTTVSGEEITPMYKIAIGNSDNKEVAEYSFTDSGIYTTDVLIEENLITLSRVVKNGDSYNAASQEYITNNEERHESKITLETYTSDPQETMVRLTFADGISGTVEPSILKPEQIIAGKPLTVTLKGSSDEEKYYVYGMGELTAIYDRAGNAVQKANQVSGVVISSDQTYVWEKGNRDLVYFTDASKFKISGNENSMDACLNYMKKYDAKQIDLTGCTLDEVLYVINKGCPVISVIDGDHAVLLTGYTLTDITYIDPLDGEEYTEDMDKMSDMTEANGNTFIGYIPS